MTEVQRAPELAALLTAHPNTRFIDAFYPDLCGILRGKRLPVSQAEKLFESGVATPASVFLLSVTGDSHDPLGMGFSDGDPDQLGFAVPGSLQPVPWAEAPTAQALLTFRDTDGTPLYYEPRNVLQRVLHRFGVLKDSSPGVPPPAVTRMTELLPEHYTYSSEDGLFEPRVDLGDEVQAGDLAGHIHFPETPARPAQAVTFASDGIVVCKRIPARCERGDCLFHLASDWAPDFNPC